MYYEKYLKYKEKYLMNYGSNIKWKFLIERLVH